MYQLDETKDTRDKVEKKTDKGENKTTYFLSDELVHFALYSRMCIYSKYPCRHACCVE